MYCETLNKKFAYFHCEIELDYFYFKNELRHCVRSRVEREKEVQWQMRAATNCAFWLSFSFDSRFSHVDNADGYICFLLLLLLFFYSLVSTLLLASFPLASSISGGGKEAGEFNSPFLTWFNNWCLIALIIPIIATRNKTEIGIIIIQLNLR